MMTAAAHIGIDSCPIEGFDRDKLETLLEEEGLLNRKQFGVSCMAAFGYRAKEPRPKTRIMGNYSMGILIFGKQWLQHLG